MSNDNWAQLEKATHLRYLKSFRTEQCKEFVDKRCLLHKPYLCFKWHFPNQRRRRPVLNVKDGTFNYSADVYCKNYNDTAGCCPQKEACRFLHRNLGDTEKRYHLRYFKTEMCVSKADSEGHCLRNGIHCAFAHSHDDLRSPVYDSTSRPRGEDNGDVVNETITRHGFISDMVAKESAVNDDSKWKDREYLLQNYKTEPCPSKSRQCRPIIACCPHYHSHKDRRRSPGPHPYKYRGVACSSVKVGDEWGFASDCHRGDECNYSHTRVELQYHPEVYARVQCDNELKGNCRKGAFCAFAHSGEVSDNHSTNEQGMASSRTSSSSELTQLTAIPRRDATNTRWTSSFSSLNHGPNGSVSNINASESNDATLYYQSPPTPSPFNTDYASLVGDDIGLLDRFELLDDQVLDDLDDASLAADAQLYGVYSHMYGTTGQQTAAELHNKDGRLPPPGWFSAANSSEFESMKRELEMMKQLARTSFDDKVKAAKERDQAQLALSKMKEGMDNQQARPTNIATVNFVAGDLEKMTFPVLQRKETQLRLDLIKLQEVMYRKANGKCVICLENVAAEAQLPCRHRSVCNSCMPDTDECPICHVAISSK